MTVPVASGAVGVELLVAGRGGTIQFYNPATMTWDRTLGLPARTQGVVTTSAGTFAFVHTATAQLEVYKLANIE